MFNETKVCRAARLALGGTLLVVALPAMAQQSAARIEVTGSRILSVNADSPAPIQVISGADIAESGAINLQDLLAKNPTIGAPGISRTNSNFSTSSAGVATIDLRNLGSDRTLVLVNGRRHVAGVPGSATVDLNAIPTDFIERVELLTGGASSTYGSDAVAGVVNIILKKNFQGLNFDVSKGRSAKGDDDREKLSVTFGANGASGKANVMGHLGYSSQGAVMSRDRSVSAIDQISTGLLSGEASELLTATRPFFSSFAPQGRFFVGGLNRTFDAQGNVIPFSTNGPAGDGVGATGFNRTQFRTIAIPTERYVMAGKGDVEFAPNTTAFFEASYVATKTRTDLEPFPLDVANIYPSGGRVPAEFMVNGAKVRNPLIPQALFNLMTDTNGDGLRDYGFTRRLSEVGNRGSTAERDTFRIVTGVRGALGNWDYDLYVGHGATKESQVGGGQVNVLNFRNALEAIPNPDPLAALTTPAICQDAQARSQKCVPLNIFGFNTISPAALQYIVAPSLLSTAVSQRLMGGTISGEPFRTKAGAVAVAAGFETRSEASRAEFDPLQAAGLNGGNALPKTEGKFDVKEVFAEVRLPLLKDAPLAKSLAFSSAVRGGDYSSVGRANSWNTGFEWKPVNDVKVRATRALSTRAPNIGELFTPPSQTFPNGLSDPCTGVTLTSAGTKDERCRAASGVVANINANGGTFTRTQADLQGISGFDRGNQDLGSEVGRSWTAGLVVTPSVVRNLSLSLDYFRIDISDAIVGTPRQFILNQCYSGDASFCKFITRRAAPIGANSAGSLEFIDSASSNSGGLFTDGFDFTAAHVATLGLGRLASRFSYTHTRTGYVIPLIGSPKDPFAGEIGAPKHKASLRLNYALGSWGISTSSAYLSASALDDTFLAEFDAKPGSVKVPSRFYHDLQVVYRVGKAQLYLGADNVTNTKAPLIPTGVTGTTTGVETAASVYDPIGRRYYGGVRLAF